MRLTLFDVLTIFLICTTVTVVVVGRSEQKCPRQPSENIVTIPQA